MARPPPNTVDPPQREPPPPQTAAPPFSNRAAARPGTRGHGAGQRCQATEPSNAVGDLLQVDSTTSPASYEMPPPGCRMAGASSASLLALDEDGSELLAMADGGDSYVHMMSDETDVNTISLSMPLENLGTSSNDGKGVGKRAGNYTHDEDIQLCKSWKNISTDPIVGNEQPGKAYWKRIAEHFHANRTFESDRNANSLEHCWSALQKECSKFQACYDKVERRHPSGIPYKEHLIEAQALFSSKKPKNKAFPYVHCWFEVRNCEKFKSLAPNKRPRSSTSPSEGAGEEEGDDGSKSLTPDSTQSVVKKRPIGRKLAKEKLKHGGEVGSYKEALQELLVVKEKEGKLKEERWRETKERHDRKLSLEERKLAWDQEQKIMFCDVNALDPDVKTYVLAMRAQLAAAAAARATLGGGFGGGFGGDFGGGSGSFDGDGTGGDMSQI